jgi:hypothetical protein
MSLVWCDHIRQSSIVDASQPSFSIRSPGTVSGDKSRATDEVKSAILTPNSLIAEAIPLWRDHSDGTHTHPPIIKVDKTTLVLTTKLYVAKSKTLAPIRIS